MKQSLCLLFAISVFSVLRAQSITPQVVASAGTHFSPGVQLSWTIGEFMTESLGTGPWVTQGFHQGKIDVQVAIADPVFRLAFTVYPNPTEGILNLLSQAPFKGEYRLMDLFGRVIDHATIQDTHRIDLNDIPQGMYVLQVLADHAIIYVAKIEKF